MKVFTSQEFIDKLKWLVNSVPNVYYSGSNWSKLNSQGKWQFDCVLSIKSILWGFKADKNLFRGGTVYKSNGVADFSCNGALDYCTEVSTDFSHLTAGEYLCMKGTKYNHTGIYLGNGKVFECTTGWKKNKCIISDISKDGTRSLNGVKNLKWTYHGKLIYIDYSDQPKPINQVMIWQEKMNEQWHCGLEVDGHFGPLCTKAGMAHQLYYGVKAPIMVKWLQNRLNQLGYSLDVDGSCGPKTVTAIKSFQKKKHLSVDGYCGSATYKALTE